MLMLKFDNKRVSERLKDAYKFINDDFTMKTTLLIKEFMERTLTIEIDDHLDEMKRRDIRTSRNGFRRRSLLTSAGFIDGIRVPRDRRSTYRPNAFERYKRIDKSVRNSIVQMYLHGVSTRKVGEVLDALTGERVSAGYVSNVTKELNDLVSEFHSRRIDTSFTYLFLDGLHVKVMDASGRAPEAVKCLERDLGKLLPFLKCPEEHRVRIRTTNVIERSFRELRRRLKVMGSFRDTDSAQRILCALMTFNNTRWNHQRKALSVSGRQRPPEAEYQEDEEQSARNRPSE